jgi:hypothetical protein
MFEPGCVQGERLSVVLTRRTGGFDAIGVRPSVPTYRNFRCVRRFVGGSGGRAGPSTMTCIILHPYKHWMWRLTKK